MLSAMLITKETSGFFIGLLSKEEQSQLLDKKSLLFAVGIVEENTPQAVALCELSGESIWLVNWTTADPFQFAEEAFVVMTDYVKAIAIEYHRYFRINVFAENEQDVSFLWLRKHEFELEAEAGHSFRFCLGDLPPALCHLPSKVPQGICYLKEISSKALKWLAQKRKNGFAPWNILAEDITNENNLIDVSCCITQADEVRSLILVRKAENKEDCLELSFIAIAPGHISDMKNLIAYCCTAAKTKYGDTQEVLTHCFDEETHKILKTCIPTLEPFSTCYRMCFFQEAADEAQIGGISNA